MAFRCCCLVSRSSLALSRINSWGRFSRTVGVSRNAFAQKLVVSCSTASGEDNEQTSGVGRKDLKSFVAEKHEVSGVFGDFSLLHGGFGHDLPKDVVQRVLELPGTNDMVDMMVRTNSMTQWRNALSKGCLPHSDAVEWPAEPFRSRFIKALQKIEMPTFTRRYPGLMKTLLNQMLDLVYDFEEKMLELEAKREQAAQDAAAENARQQSIPPMQQSDDDSSSGPASGDMSPEELTEEMAQEALDQESSGSSEGQQSDKELEIEMQSQDGSGPPEQGNPGDEGEDDGMAEELAALTEDIVKEFEDKMEPVMGSLQKAKLTFDDLSDLLDEKKGFDLKSSLWKRVGWEEMEQLRKRLENLKELRLLVRNLGRAGGRGPMRRAPAEIYHPGAPKGVIRSPLQPEETRGLSRSGDLSRMLPAEAALMAAGWPRKKNGEGEQKEGSRAARLLHLARRAERNLLSYERAGWTDDEPSRVLQRMEYRPAAEQGPIIVCLDTSGSMAGSRETVAKALTLECLRGAHRQQRACYLYAFSGPNDVSELALGLDVSSMTKLLDFLECSFHGGTDVEKALELSMDRIQMKEWELADILIVTDGEMGAPSADMLQRMDHAKQDMGLEIHGLLVGNSDSKPMEQICTHLHTFKSWDAVKRGVY